MTQTDEHKRQLVEMATELRTALVDGVFVADSPECELCGAAEFELELSEYRCVAAEYETDCIRKHCDGTTHFTELSVSVGDHIGASRYQYTDAECTAGCGVLASALADSAKCNEPAATTVSTITMEAVATNRICEHHTRYEPERTMLVCDSCHAKIHQDDAFRPDLQPEMQRQDWEEAQ